MSEKLSLIGQTNFSGGGRLYSINGMRKTRNGDMQITKVHERQGHQDVCYDCGLSIAFLRC